MEIEILNEKETDSGWTFQVKIEEKQYTITLDREYWQELFADLDPALAVKKSLQFLLKREPKEMILSEFDLRDIGKYFPEFESEIAKN